jgi:UDP-N-acetylglucosamine 2-epimerase
LIEAPYFGLPAVNIGDRQTGRERTDNVLDVPYERGAIRAAIERALWDASYRAHLKTIRPPFGDGTAHRRITDVVASVPLGDALLNKRLAY